MVSGPQVFWGSAEGRFAGGKTEAPNKGIGWTDEAGRTRLQKGADEQRVWRWLRNPPHHGGRVRWGVRNWIQTRLPFRQSGQRSGGLGDKIGVEESGEVKAEQAVRV